MSLPISSSSSLELSVSLAKGMSLFLSSIDLLTSSCDSLSLLSNLSSAAATSLESITGLSSLSPFFSLLHSETKRLSLLKDLRRVEQKWFLTQLSVRPTNCWLIFAHLFPNWLWYSNRVRYSSEVHSEFLMQGSSWLCHLSLHCFPVLPKMAKSTSIAWETALHFLILLTWMMSIKAASSSLVQAFLSPICYYRLLSPRVQVPGWTVTSETPTILFHFPGAIRNSPTLFPNLLIPPAPNALETLARLAFHYNLLFVSSMDNKDNKDNKDQSKHDKIKEKAQELGSSYYKYVDPYIVSLQEKLGEGSFGVVWKGAHITSNELVAVKQIACQKLQKDPEKLLISLKNEIEIMKKLDHENIVKLYDVRKSTNNIYLFLELCGESLEARLKKKVRLSEKQVIEIGKQIVNGYKFLVSKGIMHRDLKPANILSKDDIYKIADFGFAKISEDREEDRMHNTSVGSPLYMCPQILNGMAYSIKCDVWSLGVILYELIFGKPPIVAKSFNDLVARINRKEKPKFPVALNNKQLQEIIKSMLEYEEKDRISWKEIQDSEVFNPKKPDLAATLRQSMKVVDQFPKNSIIGSHKANEMYFNENKVVENVELDESEKQKVQEVTAEEANKQVKEEEQEDMYKTIVEKHEAKEKVKAAMKKIMNYFLFKRNKAVFINHISIKLYECFEEGSIKINLETAERILLVLSKYQCAIIFTSYIKLKEGKLMDCKVFTEEQFRSFLDSPFKAKIMDSLKNDFNIMKMFLEDLIKKVKENLEKGWETDPGLKDNKSKIQKICNSSLCPKQLMREIFSEHVKQLRELVRESIDTPSSHKLLQLGYFVSQTLQPDVFNFEKVNYNLFYEQVQKLSDDQLQQVIAKGAD